MKKPSKIKNAIYTLTFMLITTVICVSSVSLAYQLSKRKIKQNQTLLLKKAILSAAGMTFDANSPDAVDNLFSSNIKRISPSKKQIEYYIVKQGGYVIPQSGIGLWGTIQSVIGFTSDGSSLTGIYFTENDETPGLGKRIEESWFRKQFINKKGPIEMLPPDTPTNDKQFDGITGATITSKAVETMVNKAFNKVSTISLEKE